MSYITCPKCAKRDNTCGYGLAAGPMGEYVFCNSCDELLEFSLDTSYSEGERALAIASLDRHMVESFGTDNWNAEKHRLIDKWYQT